MNEYKDCQISITTSTYFLFSTPYTQIIHTTSKLFILHHFHPNYLPLPNPKQLLHPFYIPFTQIIYYTTPLLSILSLFHLLITIFLQASVPYLFSLCSCQSLHLQCHLNHGQGRLSGQPVMAMASIVETTFCTFCVD